MREVDGLGNSVIWQNKVLHLENLPPLPTKADIQENALRLEYAAISDRNHARSLEFNQYPLMSALRMNFDVSREECFWSVSNGLRLEENSILEELRQQIRNKSLLLYKSNLPHFVANFYFIFRPELTRHNISCLVTVESSVIQYLYTPYTVNCTP